jgi:hypothetical protein
MGLDVSTVREHAIVPKDRIGDFLVDLVNNVEHVDIVDDEEKEGWKPPKQNKKLRECVSRALHAGGFECSFTKSGDLSIETTDRWYDEMMDVLECAARHIEGEGYFVFYDAGDMWRYHLVEQEVFEENVCSILWTRGSKYSLVKETDLDIDIDDPVAAEKLKQALP